jgi:hypothetical protein
MAAAQKRETLSPASNAASWRDVTQSRGSQAFGASTRQLPTPYLDSIRARHLNREGAYIAAERVERTAAPATDTDPASTDWIDAPAV